MSELEPRRDPNKYIRPVIAIPDEARTPKARFHTKPERELVLSIIRHIRKTGRAFDHPDLTHTKPPLGATVVYLEPFDLPKKFARNRDLWLPCPVCSPFLPQFCKDGIIAWFPDEAVLRAIGGDCFQRLNPEGHQQALLELEQETRRRKDTDYLLRTLRVVPALRADVSRDIAIARAVDQVHRDMVEALEHYRIPLWTSIATGTLEIEKRLIDFTRGNKRVKMVRENYAHIRGASLINPALESFTWRLQAVQGTLTPIDLGTNWKETVLAMSEDHRRQAATLIRSSFRNLASVREDMEQAQRLLRAETAATLRKWSAHQGSMCPFYFEYFLDGPAYVEIGLSPRDCRKILIPEQFFERPTAMPVVALKEPH